MPTVKTAVSIQKPVFLKAEKLARKMKMPRSQLYNLALDEYLKRLESREITRSYNEAYADGLTPEEERWLEDALAYTAQLLQDQGL